MARVVFTANIQRFVPCPEVEAAGHTVRDVLENVFADNPRARGYPTRSAPPARSTFSRHCPEGNA